MLSCPDHLMGWLQEFIKHGLQCKSSQVPLEASHFRLHQMENDGTCVNFGPNIKPLPSLPLKLQANTVFFSQSDVIVCKGSVYAKHMPHKPTNGSTWIAPDDCGMSHKVIKASTFSNYQFNKKSPHLQLESQIHDSESLRKLVFLLMAALLL